MALSSQRMIKMTARASAICIRALRLNNRNPNSHKTKRIIPISNKKPMLSLFCSSSYH